MVLTMSGVGQDPLLPASAVAALGRFGELQVTPANVLGVYGVVMEEVQRLRISVQTFKSQFQSMPSLGRDPVSPHAAQGFTEATNQLLTKCQASITDLSDVADGLAAAARAYGKTETQIHNAFDPGNVGYPPTSLTSSPQELPSPLRPLPAPAQNPPRPSTPNGSLSGVTR
jgi:hypothetical protein